MFKQFCVIIGSLFILNVQSLKYTDWQDVIDKVNSKNVAWKAGLSFPSNISPNYIKRLMGTTLEFSDNKEETINSHVSFMPIEDKDIPEQFDAREKWPQCQSVISDVRDQGACGSCWAVAAASTFSDRLCIAKNITLPISAEHILSCSIIGGCLGGYLKAAWWNIKHRGSVTGGGYKSNEGCKPYSIQPCEHHIVGPRSGCDKEAATPHCTKKCTNNYYPLPYKEDFHKVKDYFTAKGEKNIQKAIISGGSVEVGFEVYEDFLVYKSGVYNHVTGSKLGGHAVKIFGWGKTKRIPYWLCANSWNTDWGDKGFFKILRGSNECGIESKAYGGIL